MSKNDLIKIGVTVVLTLVFANKIRSLPGANKIPTV